VVVTAGDRIKIEHQYVIGYAWLALIVLPPVMVALAIVVQPWVLAADLKIGRPAAAMGEFFGDNFARRTGQPLEVVGGDPALATLIALGASSRPSLYGDTSVDDRFRITREDVAEKGAVLVWRATDTAGKPPPAIAQQFPDLVPEVPHAFVRPFQGRMAPLRVGWAMIRPRSQANAPTPVAVPPAPVELPPQPAQPAVQPPPPEPVRPASPPVSTRPAGPANPAVVESQPRPEEPSASPDPQILAPEPPVHQQQRRRPRIVPYQNMHRVQ
jgi:hypothetical protein